MNEKVKGGFARRVAAVVGASVLAVAGVVAFAGPASAAPANVPTDPGSLTIHKYEQPSPVGGANDSGEEIPVPAGWVPLGGVNFSYQPIDVDLTTTEGWDAVEGYVSDPGSAPLTGSPVTVTTAADGSASVSSLAVGAYLVTELVSPGATAGGEPVTITQMAAPFVVTIPIPTGEGTWNSDVHVYPKNSITTVSKVPGAPAGAGLGETVPWTITIDIPQLADGQSYSDFRVTDTLDAKLAFASTTSVTIGGADVTPTETVNGQTVQWVFDAVAINTGQGQVLEIVFDTTVVATGAIENTADVWINDPGMTGTPITTPVATTYWGAVSILKHAAGEVANTLEGAQFAVYATEAEAAAGAEAGRIAVTRDAAGAVIPAQTVFTTGADGTVLIPGLFAGNSTDADPIERTYYLREIAAPAGYELTETPIPVTVTAAGVATPVVMAIPNPQLPAFPLPMTGGDGALMFAVAGVAILLTALGAAIIIARRRNAQA
ncbi:hypothetical protein GCM10009796_24690 [Microbacterium koreense]